MVETEVQNEICTGLTKRETGRHIEWVDGGSEVFIIALHNGTPSAG